MLKKIAIAILVIIAGVFIYYKFWVIPKIQEGFPEAMSQMQEKFEDMCNKNQDQACLVAVREHYQKCSFSVMPKDISLSNIKVKLKDYINNVHACIENDSKIKLPSIWDYWAKYEN